MRIDLPWYSALILALGTWLIYVADRILDGHRRAPATTLQKRHRFHARYRIAFLSTAVVVSVTLVWLIASRMTPQARLEDTILFAGAMLYFFLVHKTTGQEKPWLPKELAVGVVFAAATAVPSWSRLGAGRTTILPAIVLFAALCWLNCVAIERWENLSLTEPAERLVRSHPTTRWTAAHFHRAVLLLAAIAAILAAFETYRMSMGTPQKIIPVYLAVLAAALGFAILDGYRSRFSRMHLRIAADAVLLTPLLFLPFLG
jgi:hypothetical protein